MKEHSKRYMIVFRTWNPERTLTYSCDEYDTVEEYKADEKLLIQLYKDTLKPRKNPDYWLRHTYLTEENRYWWGYYILDFEKEDIVGRGGTDYMSNDGYLIMKIKDNYFRKDDEIPEDYEWKEGEYKGWLQFRWGDGKNALDYVPPKKQKASVVEVDEIDNSEYDDYDYEAEHIQTTMEDLIDKERLERIKERW